MIRKRWLPASDAGTSNLPTRTSATHVAAGIATDALREGVSTETCGVFTGPSSRVPLVAIPSVTAPRLR